MSGHTQGVPVEDVRHYLSVLTEQKDWQDRVADDVQIEAIQTALALCCAGARDVPVPVNYWDRWVYLARNPRKQGARP